MGIFSNGSSWWNPLSWFSIDSVDGKRPFYPINSAMTYQIGTEGPILLDTAKPTVIYESVPEFKMIVNRFGHMLANGVFMVVDKEGKNVSEKYQDRLNLLEKPAPGKTQNEWLFEMTVHRNVYGNQFTYINKPSASGKLPLTMPNIPPVYVKPVLTGKYLDQLEMKGIIKHFIYCTGQGPDRELKTDQVIYMKIPDIENPILGKSPVMSLQYPLSNIILNYKYVNAALGRTGAIGFLTKRKASGNAGFATDKKEKERILSELTKGFGTGEGQNAINYYDSDVEFKHVIFPFKEMLLLEQIGANKETICNMYGLDVNIFGSEKSTFENVRNGLIRSYQDAIIPFADSIGQAFTEALGITGGDRLILSYDHLAILKTDRDKAATTFKTMVDALAQLVEKKMLTDKEYKEIIDNELANLRN